jgi:hypothetical protein
MIVMASKGPQMEASVAPISKNTAAPQIAVKMRCSRKAFMVAHRAIGRLGLYSPKLGVVRYFQGQSCSVLSLGFRADCFTAFTHRELVHSSS